MTIAAILATKGHEVVSVSPEERVGAAVALLADRRIGAVPVMEGDSVAGVLSERDVLYRLAASGAAVLDQTVRAVMTAPAVTVTPDQPVIGALSLMTRRRIRHLPVVDGGKVVGLVSIGDLVKYRIERIERDAEAMRTYIQSA